MTRRASPMPSLKRLATRQPPSSACKAAHPTSLILAASCKPTTSISAVCAEGEVTATLNTLKASPATAKAKAKFTLATDGITLEAEDLSTNETVACDYKDFPNHFGFFLPLAGISTVKQIRDNSFDIRATSRLNRLYVELLKSNAAWGTSERRHDMNHFMARLIFCFFRRRHRHIQWRQPVYRPPSSK